MNAVIAMVALILVSSAISCSSGLSEAEFAYNNGTDLSERGLYAEAVPDFNIRFWVARVRIS